MYLYIVGPALPTETYTYICIRIYVKQKRERKRENERCSLVAMSRSFREAVSVKKC